MQRAHDIRFRHEAIVEHQLGGGRAAHPHFIDMLADAEARHALLDQKGGDTLRSLSRLGIDDECIRFRRVGDPEFGAVEPEAGFSAFGNGLGL